MFLSFFLPGHSCWNVSCCEVPVFVPARTFLLKYFMFEVPARTFLLKVHVAMFFLSCQVVLVAFLLVYFL
jgi:hypothetical protein